MPVTHGEGLEITGSFIQIVCIAWVNVFTSRGQLFSSKRLNRKTTFNVWIPHKLYFKWCCCILSVQLKFGQIKGDVYRLVSFTRTGWLFKVVLALSSCFLVSLDWFLWNDIFSFTSPTYTLVLLLWNLSMPDLWNDVCSVPHICSRFTRVSSETGLEWINRYIFGVKANACAWCIMTWRMMEGLFHFHLTPELSGGANNEGN